MDKEIAFKEVQHNIAVKNSEAVGPQVMEIAAAFGNDPITLLTCASLLKVVEDDGRVNAVVNMIGECNMDENLKLEVSKGLRGLGLLKDAENMLKTLAINDEIQRERMAVCVGLGDYPAAVKEYGLIQEPLVDDDLLLTDAYCLMKNYGEAVKKLDSLSEEYPNDYDIQKSRVSVLMMSGKDKEAEKFIRDILKKDRKSADANALAAFFMWMSGKTSAAGGYAAKAVKADSTHIGAMEILAYCLIDKGKTDNAKIVAGAINEQAPGHPAVVRILERTR